MDDRTMTVNIIKILCITGMALVLAIIGCTLGLEVIDDPEPHERVIVKEITNHLEPKENDALKLCLKYADQWNNAEAFNRVYNNCIDGAKKSWHE